MFFKKNYQGILLIDIHDVLTNLQDFKLRQGNVFAKKYGYKLVRPNAFDTKEMFDWPIENDEEFWRLYLPQFMTSFGAKHLAPEALYKLSQSNYKIILFHQPATLELTPDMQKYHQKHLKLWLERYHISYDDYLYTTKDLLSVAKSLKVTHFLSANSSFVEHMATSYPSLLFSNNYNSGLDGVHITRVSDWKEAYQRIKTNNLT